MAINCKICNVELDVFSGGRCRKCRQLVCKKCTATGDVGSAKGLLCKSCAAGERALKKDKAVVLFESESTVINHVAAEENQPAASAVENFSLRRHLKIIAAVAVASVIFISIIVYPLVNEWQNLRVLKVGDDIDAEIAIARLAKRGGSQRLRDKLFALIENAPDPVRQRAVKTLGKIPTTSSREYLEELLRQSRFETPLFRAGIVEALREQERDGIRDE